MNIAKLNTASLDDKTFIIKRGTSGGSTPDTPSGGESNIEYLDLSGDSPLRETLISFCYLIKTDGFMIERPDGSALNAGRGVIPAGNLIQAMVGITYEEYSIITGSIKAVAIDFNTEIVMGDNSNPIKDVFTGAEELLDTLPRLTKEQFYSLE